MAGGRCGNRRTVPTSPLPTELRELLSIHYGGDPYPNRESGRVNAWIEIDRWHGWGAVKNAG